MTELSRLRGSEGCAVRDDEATEKSHFNALNVFLYFCISVTPFRPDFSRLNCDLSVAQNGRGVRSRRRLQAPSGKLSFILKKESSPHPERNSLWC